MNNILDNNNEGISHVADTLHGYNESAKKVISELTKKAENPLNSFLDLIDESSPCYILGYN